MAVDKNYERFSVSIPSELNHTFEQIRTELNISRSDAIRKAMRLFINQESQNLSNDLESNVLGTITYLEKSHIHGHPLEYPEDPHEHGEITHVHQDAGNYYVPTEQYEYIHATELEHDFTDVIVSTTHIHAGAEKCMLVIAVHGAYPRIKEFLQRLTAFKTIENIQFSIVEISQ